MPGSWERSMGPYSATGSAERAAIARPGATRSRCNVTSRSGDAPVSSVDKRSRVSAAAGASGYDVARPRATSTTRVASEPDQAAYSGAVRSEEHTSELQSRELIS